MIVDRLGTVDNLSLGPVPCDKPDFASCLQSEGV